MSEQYAGTCPICGVTLIVIPGNKLQCLDKHFVCDRWAFERRWDTFQELVSRGKFASTTKLLIDLVKLNELNIDPGIIEAFREKQERDFKVESDLLIKSLLSDDADDITHDNEQ